MSRAPAPPRDGDYLATYGTLMSGYETQRELGVEPLLELRGSCTLRGDLFDLGDSPGLASGDNEVAGELYRVLDARAFDVLDPFELFDPSDAAASFYQRTRARLLQPDVDAWVYVLSERPEQSRLIASGRWTHPAEQEPR